MVVLLLSTSAIEGHGGMTVPHVQAYVITNCITKACCMCYSELSDAAVCWCLVEKRDRKAGKLRLDRGGWSLELSSGSRLALACWRIYNHPGQYSGTRNHVIERGTVCEAYYTNASRL